MGVTARRTENQSDQLRSLAAGDVWIICSGDQFSETDQWKFRSCCGSKFGIDRGRLSKCFSFIMKSVQSTHEYPHNSIDGGGAHEVISNSLCIKLEHECMRVGMRPLPLIKAVWYPRSINSFVVDSFWYLLCRSTNDLSSDA